MFSSVQTAGKRNETQDSGFNLILDSKIAATIPISGSPVKEIFTDILASASRNRSLNLSVYQERIYEENVEQTNLVQG